MTAGDGDPILQAHQLRQQFAPRDDGDLQAACFQQFGILLIHGGAHHQGARSGDVRGGVALVDTGSHGGQTVGYGREFYVRPTDLVAEVEQHFGDAAHPNSPDPRKMQVLRTKKTLYCFIVSALKGNCQSKIAVHPSATSSRISAARFAAPGLAS